MSKELECLKRIDERNYRTEREHKEFLKVVEQVIEELEQIKNSNPSEALMFIQELLDISETEKHFINLAYYDTRLNLIKIKQALTTKSKKELAFDELKELVNGLEETFNRKGIASINDDNLGTVVKDYFLDNASDLLKEVFKDE